MINYRIGIDADVDKSGFAVIRIEPFKKSQIVQLITLDLFDLCYMLKSLHEIYKEADKVEYMVYIEAGWLNNLVNHHSKYFDKKLKKWVEKNVGAREKTSINVGANLEIGKQIEKFCKKNDIKYKLYKPTSSKWDAKRFKMITGWEGRTNSEMRDAVRAAWL